MARLVGVDLPRDKRLEVALTYIYGMGKTRATETLNATGISPDRRVHQMSDEVQLFVSKTLELGRVPQEEDFAGEGSCGSGCGCHH